MEEKSRSESAVDDLESLPAIPIRVLNTGMRDFLGEKDTLRYRESQCKRRRAQGAGRRYQDAEPLLK